MSDESNSGGAAGFAKLYDTDLGQILVKKDTAENGAPIVGIYFEPETLGVCCVSVAFPDTDAGYEKQEAMFDEMAVDKAYEAVKGLIKKLDSGEVL